MSTNSLFVRDALGVSLATVIAIALCLVLASHHHEEDPHARAGLAVYATKGCIDCHTMDGTPRVGPTFRHGKVPVDETYIRRAMLSGHRAELKPNEVDDLVAYIVSLK